MYLERCGFMNCSLVAAITAIACAVAEEIEDDEELALLAAVLVQLSDTLNTIIVQRELSENRPEAIERPPVY
jgi:hypothetical protein